MQCEIRQGEQRVGFLRQEQQGLYTRFYGEVTTKEVTKVYAVFEGGECPLGVPVPEHGKMVLRASMPTSRLPRGSLLSGRIAQQESPWQPFPGGVLGGVRYPAGEKKGETLRFLWKPGEPFPAEEVILFYELSDQHGKTYLMIQLNPDGTVWIQKKPPKA